jgi:hypothetical protein
MFDKVLELFLRTEPIEYRPNPLELFLINFMHVVVELGYDGWDQSRIWFDIHPILKLNKAIV